MESNYQDRIPNNVDLGSNRTLQRALEHWQPEFLNWWHGLGPSDFNANDIYLRTAISVDTKGWATFGYVKMPEYRWGVLLAPQDDKRHVNFGASKGEKAWQEVPGEHRANLRRIIVTQGDTEPASVEQQRALGPAGRAALEDHPFVCGQHGERLQEVRGRAIAASVRCLPLGSNFRRSPHFRGEGMDRSAHMNHLLASGSD